MERLVSFLTQLLKTIALFLMFVAGAVQMMSPPFGAIPFPFGMFPPQPGQEKVSPENTSQDGEMKSPEAEAEEKTENVDAILDDPDVSQHADV